MQTVLGVDYGRRKIGLSIAYSFVAEPLLVIRYENAKKALGEIKKIVKKEEVERIIMGISEGESADEAKKFGKNLQKSLEINVDFQDETFSTKEAQTLSIEAGVKRKKRKEMEDAYAATIILQNYLDGKI